MLDAGCQALPGMWYLLAAEGEGPCPRVGHACCVVATTQCQHEKDKDGTAGAEGNSQNKQQDIIILGGATPDGPFNDMYFLELCKLPRLCRIRQDQCKM